MHSFVGAVQPAPKFSHQEATRSTPMVSRKKAKKSAPITEIQANKINIRQMEAGGIGYGQGYTTLEAFLTPTMTFDSWMPFADLRGHRFDNGLYAFNTGLGLRYLTPSNCTVWGANVYYDYRQTKQVNFKQIGVGLEALGAHWDYRINGYIPFGKRESGYYQAKFKEFKGNNLIVNVKKKFDMYGVNAEAAYHWMPTKNIEVTGALGPYYFTGKFDNFAAGGQARLKAFFLNAISIEGIGSYDNLFKWNGQGQVAFSIPLGPKVKTRGIASSQCNTKTALDLSLVRPVQRFEIIVADSYKQSKTALNPGTDIPLHFIFVNNDPSSTPNGTAENPFVTLAQAQDGSSPGDIIYVFGSPIIYGPASPGGNVITLQDNQQFLGSGIAQRFKTGYGTVYAPATTRPMLSNGTLAPDSLLILANNNTVSGFSFPSLDVIVLNQVVPAINGTSITNATIQDNLFNLSSTSSEAQYAIGFINCGGNITLKNNTMTASATDTSLDTAIFISPSAANPGIYNIIGNNFTGNGSSNLTVYFLTYNNAALNIDLVTTTYPDQLNVIGNTINNWPLGVNAFYNSTSAEQGSFQFRVNTFQGSQAQFSDATRTTVEQGSCTVVLTGNSFTLTEGNLIGARSTGNLTAQINNNIFTNTGVLGSLTIAPIGFTPHTTECVQLNYNFFDVSPKLNADGTPFFLETPIGNAGPGATPTLSGVTVLPRGQTCND